MKDLISSKHRHLLWKDEIGDDFVLTNICSIYRYSDSILSIIFFSRTIPTHLKPLIFDYFRTDDLLHTCKTNVENLPVFLATAKWKIRPDINGNFIKKLEKRLAHKIIPYRPEKLKVANNPVIKRYKNLINKSRHLECNQYPI